MAENSYPRTSLLGLPPELRLMIWKLLVAPGGKVHIRGNATRPPGVDYKPFIFENPWALPRVCKAFQRELGPMCPGIKDIEFCFESMTMDEIREWGEIMGERNVAKVRQFKCSGWAECVDSVYSTMHPDDPSLDDREIDCNGRKAGQGSVGTDKWYLFHGFCHRAASVNLATFEQDFRNQPNHAFLDAHELLERDGYVAIPVCGNIIYNSECTECDLYSYDSSSLVSDDGKVTIDIISILDFNPACEEFCALQEPEMLGR